jgi:hypothetical protein
VRSPTSSEENGGGMSDLFLAIDTQLWWEFLEHPDCTDAVHSSGGNYQLDRYSAVARCIWICKALLVTSNIIGGY